MAIRTGDKAPAFTLPSKPGNPVDISQHFGREPVVLLFIPLAFSSTCTAAMCHFRDTWQHWESVNARVYGISVDSPFVTDRFRDAEKLPFPVLSDFNKDVSRLYGVLHEDLMGLKGVSKRSAFVIGKDGRVKYAWVTDDPKVQVKFDEVKAAVGSG
jgi:peroxiredoxin